MQQGIQTAKEDKTQSQQEAEGDLFRLRQKEAKQIIIQPIPMRSRPNRDVPQHLRI
jgi:hypothetical protein